MNEPRLCRHSRSEIVLACMAVFLPGIIVVQIGDKRPDLFAPPAFDE